MNIYRESLDVIFRKIPPELLKDELLESVEKNYEPKVSVSGIRVKEFNRSSHQNFSDLSADEIERIHSFISQKMNDCNNLPATVGTPAWNATRRCSGNNRVLKTACHKCVQAVLFVDDFDMRITAE